jgi:type IV pilus assembly protein PilC
MKFTYTATDKSGKTLNNSMEAVDRQGVIESLNKQGLKPITVKAEGGAQKVKKRSKVKIKEIVAFTRQFSTMVSAGVPISRSLYTLQEQAESENFKQVVGGVAKDAESGVALADSFAKYPNAFNDVYVNMVRAGEAGGILDEILKRLATQLEKDASMRKKIKSAMMYPMVISFITVAAFFGIMVFVVPKIAEILTDLGGPDAKLPPYTQAMIAISDFMTGNIVLIGVITFVGGYLLKRYINSPTGKYKYHSLLLKIPIMKTIVTKIAVARFASTFAALMGAGVGVLDSLEVTGGAIGNKVIEAELKEASKQVKNGKQLSQPLSKSPHFPPIIGQMLSVGEETGQIDTVLVKVADFYEEEVEATIDGLSSIIEPLMIVVLGSLVGIIAASVMGPIASLSQNVGK